MSRLASLLAAVPEPLTDLAGILTAVGVIIGSIWTAGRVLLNAFDKRALINTSNDDVLTGDFLRVDIDGAGTGAKGLIVMVTLQPV